MPSSRPYAIPAVLSLVRQIEPKRILEIGPGFGKWGVLLREYTDIIASEKTPTRYDKPNWQVQIDCIEVFERYITPLHKYVYNNVYVGNASEVTNELGQYDFVFIGDVIEHFTEADGRSLIQIIMQHIDIGYIVLTTPRSDTGQATLCGNPYEAHHSVWNKSLFESVGNCRVYRTEGDLLLAVYQVGEATMVTPSSETLRNVIQKVLDPGTWGRLCNRILARMKGRS